MTIQEAIKNVRKNKVIRRPTWDSKSFLEYDPIDRRLIFYNGGKVFCEDECLSVREILAEDWQIVERK